MANKNQPQGFIPYGRIISANSYVAAAIVYPGDPVKLNGDAEVSASIQFDPAPAGVALGYAAAGEHVLVADSPDQLYVCQVNGAGITSKAGFSLYYDVTNTAGDAINKRSRREIDAATAGSDHTVLPIRIFRAELSPDNELGANIDVICNLNFNCLGNPGGGL